MVGAAINQGSCQGFIDGFTHSSFEDRGALQSSAPFESALPPTRILNVRGSLNEAVSATCVLFETEVRNGGCCWLDWGRLLLREASCREVWQGHVTPALVSCLFVPNLSR